MFSVLAATSAIAAEPPASQSADHDALRALVPVYEKAVGEGRPDTLKPFLDPQFTGVMLTGDALDGPASLDGYWSKIRGLLGDGGTYRLKVNVAAPALIDGDLAVASGTTDDTVDAKGQHYEFHSRWTAVCRKSGDAWKLLRVQATIDPIFNPFVQTAVRRTALTAGGVAGGVGLLIGLLLGAALWRRRTTGPRS